MSSSGFYNQSSSFLSNSGVGGSGGNQGSSGHNSSINTIWYLLVDNSGRQPLTDLTKLPLSSINDVDDLKKAIKEEHQLNDVHHSRLTVWKLDEPVSCRDAVHKNFLITVRYVSYGGDIEYHTGERRCQELAAFDEVPELLNNEVGLIIRCPASASTSHNPNGIPLHLRPQFEAYQETFIKVGEWGKFPVRLLEENRISELTSENHSKIVEIVKKFEEDLDRKFSQPRFTETEITSQSLKDALQICGDRADKGIHDTYFGDKAGPPPERYELLPTMGMVSEDWEERYKPSGTNPTLSERDIKARLFSILWTSDPRIIIHSKNAQVPFPVIMCKEDATTSEERFRSYHPRPDHLIEMSNVPRHFLEHQSQSVDRAEDRIRMLVTAAAVVRFANRFLSPYTIIRNFIAVCIFSNKACQVSRYIVFEQDNKILYKTKDFDLLQSEGRIKFTIHLQNFLHQLKNIEEDAENTKKNVDHFREAIKEVQLRGFTSKTEQQSKKRKTISKDDGGSSQPKDSSDAMQDSSDTIKLLKAHGFILKPLEPRTWEDEHGVWTKLDQDPDHIRQVVSTKNPDAKFVAKIVSSKSQEPKILEYLDGKSDHIIQLINTFHTDVGTLMIFPRLKPLTHCLGLPKCSTYELCSGLIKGLVFLHRHLIAHRDIKPDNLLVDPQSLLLKIIDFGCALRMKDENDLVTSRCGTETWMAPEVEKASVSSPYNPILADRWSCGKVILYIVGDRNSRASRFGLSLTAENPKERPSLLDGLDMVRTRPLVLDEGQVASEEPLPKYRKLMPDWIGRMAVQAH